jgi:hypothetical protein
MRGITAISLIFFSLTLFATEQTPDLLIYKSDTIYIESYPLEYLMDNDSIINKALFFLDDMCISTDCWRGHIATWKIENDSLFLVNLVDCCYGYQLDMDKIFGKTSSKVFAGWYSGELTEYQSWFSKKNKNSNSFRCKIINGRVEFLNHEKSTVRKRAAVLIDNFISTDTSIYVRVDKNPILLTEDKNYEITELKHFIAENIRFPQNDDCMGTVYISFVVEKNGTVSNKNFVRKLCDSYDKETMNVIDLMTNWKPGLIRGIPVRTQITLPVKYIFE